MTAFRKTLLWLLLAVFGLSTAALADRDKNERELAAWRAKKLDQLRLEWAAAGKTYGACQAGVAFADLDINAVRARLYNNGGLFWKGAGPLYNVPQSGAGNAIFASGIWIGGLVNGELRMAATPYGPWEFWPGPLDDNGNAPADCGIYDRMFKVNRQDVLDYNDTGVAVPDLADWPFELGAPVIDGDGNPNNYNLAGGDRPEILGDQTIWWVMNDKGNEHAWSLTQPIGIEVQVTAFAFKTADAINNTTFYKYKLLNKGGVQMTETYFGVWSDPDLGDAGDDYVGSDTTLGLGFVWNGDDFDGGSDGYGDRPPALGYDFFQGPLVNDDGIDNDGDGEIDEADERIGGTKFVYYNNDSTVQGNPSAGEDAYRYLRGLWRNDVPITLGGTGLGFSNTPVDYMFPGHPPAFWSEENVDGAGSRNTPADRRFIISSGPFTLQPNAVQEIVYGIVWAQAGDRFASVDKMKSDDALAQAAFNVNFELPPPPDPPRIEVAELDGTIVLKWGYRPSDNNYLDQYEVENPFLADVDVEDKTYNFEGYQVFQFRSENDLVGTVIGTFDVAGNGVTRVVDITDATTNIPVASVAVNGTDSGVKHSMQFNNLTNYTDYYFGVQAYAYNENSSPLISKSAISRVKVRPSKQLARNGGTAINEDAVAAAIAGEATFTLDNEKVTKVGVGGGLVSATVVDPSQLTGDTYTVNFYSVDVSDDPEHPELVTNYDIVNSAGTKIFDGATAIAAFGGAAPQGDDVLIADGLSWTVSGPAPAAYDIDGGGTYAFVQVEGAAGVEADACGPGAVSRFGCAETGGNWVYGSFNGAGDWVMYHIGDGPEASIGPHAPNDFEIRVTDDVSYGQYIFTSGNTIATPFEVWDIGPTGLFGVNDPSDDVQMIPVLFADGGGECFFGFGEADDPFGLGWQVTERIYAYYAVDNDYAAWHSAAKALVDAHPEGCPTSPETDPLFDLMDLGRGRPIQRIVFMMDPTSPLYRDEMIPVGNVIRFYTTKPNLPGDVFTVNTAGFEVKRQDAASAEEALDALAIVPNPYKGASNYELTNLADVARFTNMPQTATIRVFTLSGSLIKTLNKSGPSTSLDWDLTTEEGLPIASGMYLIHVEVPNVGEKVIKFGVVKKRIQLDLL
ncbi:MAG TPA: T9SS type A sorting domain-containing protein [Rhodothermales bacterium]|nr:T9SS type A sorting domain-containing protein [Rhodothermales bacterium]